MARFIASLLALSIASPALAASGPFFSLENTNFVVLIAFLLFIAALLYLKVPGMLGKLLDKRAVDIQSDLDDARALREEAQTLLASYQRKQKEVQEQANRIVTQAKVEAEAAAEEAKVNLQASIKRRLQAAEEQIASAEARAVKEVRDQAASIAIAAANDVIAKQMTSEMSKKLIDDAIADVDAKLH